MTTAITVPAQATRCVVTGATSGVGLAVVRQLLDEDHDLRVYALARSAETSPDLAALVAATADRLTPIACDLGNDASITAAAGRIAADTDAIDLVFNAAGLLHGPGLRPEKSLTQVSLASLQRSFAVNAFAPILLAGALLPLLRHGRRAVFASLSARVGSIGDNRLGGWYAYRAAKAAQNQLLRTFAIELARINPAAVCLLLHPGTVDTPLSTPFQATVPAEKLFTPAYAARCLLDIVQRATPADSGRFFAWDGSEIAW